MTSCPSKKGERVKWMLALSQETINGPKWRIWWEKPTSASFNEICKSWWEQDVQNNIWDKKGTPCEGPGRLHLSASWHASQYESVKQTNCIIMKLAAIEKGKQLIQTENITWPAGLTLSKDQIVNLQWKLFVSSTYQGAHRQHFQTQSFRRPEY